MNKHDLFEQVLASVDDDLKKQFLQALIENNGNGRKTVRVPQLNRHQFQLDYDAIFERMKLISGGTSASVARTLDISPQAYNNQRRRGNISPKSIVDLHLRTGVSLDWLIGSWDGYSTDHVSHMTMVSDYGSPRKPTEKFVSLVEIYDQHSGGMELKWCLTKRQECHDEENRPLPNDLGALLSLIVRYKDETGTPERVKKGGKRHFQVRRVLAYVVGEPQVTRKIDALAKKQTLQHISDLLDRTGKTEFRCYTSRKECLHVLARIAEQNGLHMVEPQINTIPWDFLIGKGSLSPREWVLSRMKEMSCTRPLHIADASQGGDQCQYAM